MAVQTKEITIAHSPDSDDAFMFYGLAHDKIDTKGIKVNQVLKDIQSLNQDAINGRYEVSAISFAAYPQVKERYMLMPCGASMGENYGPMIVAKAGVTLQDLKEITLAVPGLLTTAYLALRLWAPFEIKIEVVPFDQIVAKVQSGEYKAGLIIHEGQVTYKQDGLEKLVDLGEWFFKETNGLPLPLGGNVVRKDLGMEMVKEATNIFKNSIVYSLENRQAALDYAMTFARDMESRLADKFVGMYVNELTVDYGERGRTAVKTLFKMAYDKKIFDELIVPEFVD